jgi:hypothetical protein
VTNAAAIPGGIRPESNVIPLDSALNAVQGSAVQDKQDRNSARDRTTERPEAKAAATSTHARISSIDPWDALARVVSLLRPDWQPERIRGALLDDKRPPRDVVAAAVACALDPDTRHPAAIAHRSTGRATPTPPAMRGDTCTTHLGELAATCRGCAADRKARREETT